MAMDLILLRELANDQLPNLLAILGLLLSWELHDLEKRAGRIRSWNIFDGSYVKTWIKSHAPVHMFIHITPNDAIACEACRSASGIVFSPSAVHVKGFQAQATPCSNPAGCRCVVVGLVGNWPDAEQLWTSLQGPEDSHCLSESEVMELLKSASPTAATAKDRLGLYLLEAFQTEGTNPQFAMSRYRSLISHARNGHDHPYIVPAYMRLSELLERTGNYGVALDVVDEFMTTARHKSRMQGPTRGQTKLMSARQVRLLRVLQRQ